MTKLIPDPKAPNRSADYIYGERMEPFEERMNFFLNEKPETKKDNVKEEDKAEVEGLESIIKSFPCLTVKPVEFVEETSVDGLEAANKGRKFIDFLVQLAKDAVEFIMNLINNRVSRIANKEARITFERKRNGIKSDPVKYPAGIRRLLHPLKVSSDPNWVNAVLKEVDDFYSNTIKAYKLLTSKIKETNTSGFNIASAISDTIRDASKQLSMKPSADEYHTDVLPGNKRLVFADVNDADVSQIGIYFLASTNDTKLKEPEFQPTSFMVDDTLSTIKKLVNNIKSNQSTISQLYRTFEKETKSFQNNTTGLTTEQKDYLNWLIRFNKRLMSTSIQYVLNCLDTGLDFITAGLKDG